MSADRVMQIDGDRLWVSLMEMAKIGATKKGGSCRLALTDEDRRGRDLFVEWCEEAGCKIYEHELYSDALGEPGSPAESFLGMFRFNLETIVNALGEKSGNSK